MQRQMTSLELPFEECEAHSDQSPAEENDGQKSIGLRFLAPAFMPENSCGPDVDGASPDHCRCRQVINGIGRGPDRQNAGGDQCGHQPWLALRVKLRTEKKENAGNAKQPVIKRILERSFAGLSRECRPEIMQREQAPARCPHQQVRLPFYAVDVREETRPKRG